MIVKLIKIIFNLKKTIHEEYETVYLSIVFLV